MKMPPMFTDAERAELRALAKRQGADDRRASIIADLSCLAVERSVEALMTVIRTTPDVGAAMATTELALQLAAQHYADKAKTVSQFTAAMSRVFASADTAGSGSANG